MKLSIIVSSVALLAGCGGGSSSSEPADQADPSVDALTQTLAFVDEGSIKHGTVDGKAVGVLGESSELKKPLDSLENSYGFNAEEYRVSAADLAALSADTKKLAHFVYMALNPSMPSDESDVTDVTVTPISRGQAYGAITSATGITGKAATPAAQQSMRLVIKSLLSKPTRAVYHVSYCPDWCDEDLIAITTSGEIRVVFGFGDI
jgi:hypothetical protein